VPLGATPENPIEIEFDMDDGSNDNKNDEDDNNDDLASAWILARTPCARELATLPNRPEFWGKCTRVIHSIWLSFVHLPIELLLVYIPRRHTLSPSL
jgi:hypothetical protein